MGPDPSLRKLFTAVLLSVAFWINKAEADSISFIRDTEIENTVRVYVRPVFEAAGLDSAAVKVYVVKNDALNAFVAGGQNIFLHTGTLRKAKLPEEVMGVIAHEAGHITGGHLSHMHNNLEQARLTNLAALALGLPLAILSGRADIGLAASSLGSHVATRDYLKYSRENEQAADQAAISYLEKAEVNPQGMLTFMRRLNQTARLYQGSSPNPYAQTHPLTADRVRFLNDSVARSAHRGRRLPAYFYNLHERMQSKLDAYIEPPENYLRDHPKNQGSLSDRYGRPMALLRLARHDQALEEINGLIENYPDDPFFVEFKGDILLDKGDLLNAEAAYKAVLDKLPWAALVQINMARVLLAQKTPEKDEVALAHLNNAKLYEPDNKRMWRLFATAYARLGDKGMLALSLAESEIRSRNAKEAKRHAQAALNHLPQTGGAALRARDIINQASQALEKQS